MISPKAAQQMVRLNSSAYFPILLQIVSTAFDGGEMCLVNNKTDLEYGGKTYRAACFEFSPPKYTDKKIGNATLSISTINQEVLIAIREMRERATANVIAAFYYDDGVLTFEPMEEWSFSLRRVSWNELVATWEMIFDDRMDNVAISDRLSPQKCPALA